MIELLVSAGMGLCVSLLMWIINSFNKRFDRIESLLDTCASHEDLKESANNINKQIDNVNNRVNSVNNRVDNIVDVLLDLKSRAK